MSHPRPGEFKKPVTQPSSLPSSQMRTDTDLNGASAPQSTPAWTVRRARHIPKAAPSMRRYDIMWCTSNGDLMDNTTMAPALPVFETAFNAFARGALIATQNGPIAVEDLLPGDLVETADGDCLPVQWIGSMELDAEGTRAPDAEPEGLVRLMADSFGLGRPSPDLMLGSGARYMHRTDALKPYLGTTMALAPVAALVDGHSAIKVTPISSVRTYHFCLPQHRLILANGVELESYHPGTSASGQLVGDLRAKFMALFPHLTELGDFGAMVHPRLSMGDLLALDAA